MTGKGLQRLYLYIYLGRFLEFTKMDRDDISLDSARDRGGLWANIQSWLKPQEREEVRRAVGHDLIERNEVGHLLQRIRVSSRDP